uniref:Peptidase n=1 Tax=Siphoviridae sp. ct0Bp21 TaxID=2825291 RepID=A0A8S5V2Z0_9CAUD|nr:MAG TPA: peptidase [Siphoviridae sp. ct0Bp21]
MADKPVTREEKYLAYLTGDYTGEIPKPITRKEKYLYELCLKGIGGEISPEEIKNAVNEYLEKNPVKPGATTEQAQQIEQNKTDIASLKTETGSLKEDLVDQNETINQIKKNIGFDSRIIAEEPLPILFIADEKEYLIDRYDVDIFNVSNVFNKDAFVAKKRFDDNGNIISDETSSYINQLIPVPTGKVVFYSNKAIQRFYGFDKHKIFVKRFGVVREDSRDENIIDENIAYVMLQVATSVQNDLDNIIVTILKNDFTQPKPTKYVPFSLGKKYKKIQSNVNNLIRSDNEGSVKIALKTDYNLYTDKSSKLFKTDIDVWEPSKIDDGYSNPTSGWGRDTKRADWTATDKYKYYDFLKHYYDCYLAISSDGYRVIKRSLGQDSANTGHELFEYDFCPVNYEYTVMLSAGMNADETQGIWGLATFIRCVMNNEEEQLKIAHEKIRFKVIPIINASGFDEDTLRYNYSDGVNPNFNFNYKDSWARQTGSKKGDYPDSNCVTQYLKQWINENNNADLWLDLHTGRWVVDGGTNTRVLDIRVADESMVQPFSSILSKFNAYYNNGQCDVSSYRDNIDYQKIVYAFDNCGIKSIMPEMHLESTAYGADGYTNNTPQGIKCYVAQIRAMVMCYINESTKKSLIIDDVKNSLLHDRYN